VTKLSSSGDALIYSTYLGGITSDFGFGLAVVDSHAYVTGYTISSDFPTLNPYQTAQSDADVFVSKLGITGNTLVYSTYLGGFADDVAHGIAVNAGGNAYVIGETFSPEFPTQNPYQTEQGSGDVFVTKLGSSGDALIYSTYLGGGGNESGIGITVDGGGNCYVTGRTDSPDFPTQNPYQGTYQGGANDIFVTKLSASGNALIYSTYVGGESSEAGSSIAVDGGGNVYVTGYTSSANFPVLHSYQETFQGFADAFVTKLGSSGDALIYSTFLGGSDDDDANAIAVDDNGNAYVSGSTASTDFPILNPYQTDQGGEDAFVTMIGVPDTDVDGVPDIDDNCPYHFNPDQENFDAVGPGDSCSMPSYLSPLTVVARYVAPAPPAPTNPPGDPNVNLKVIDPDGLYIGADSVSVITNTIGGSANYYQVNGNDSVVIVDPKTGNYTVEVIPEDEAGPGEKYLVGIRIDGTVESVDEAKLVPAQGERDTVFIFNIPYAFGDADGGRDVNIGDALFIISYIFSGGPDPIPLSSADADCGGDINIGDVLLIIDFIFGGPLPDPGCGP